MGKSMRGGEREKGNVVGNVVKGSEEGHERKGMRRGC